MHKRWEPATDEALVHACADLFDEVGPETPEEIDAALREAGHDPETLAAWMKAAAERAAADFQLTRPLIAPILQGGLNVAVMRLQRLTRMPENRN